LSLKHICNSKLANLRNEMWQTHLYFKMANLKK
jgi:hypothetical protein